MRVGTVIIYYFTILILSSIEDIFTNGKCNKTIGDCVASEPRKICEDDDCTQKYDDCESFTKVDYFGEQARYQCHCKNVTDCQFVPFSKCKNGCEKGYKRPYCQIRLYHTFLRNTDSQYAALFLSDKAEKADKAKKPPIEIKFNNIYRISTVIITSNFTDSAHDIKYPVGMKCSPKPSKDATVCTGDITTDILNISGIHAIKGIKLLGCPPYLYGPNCTQECHCSNWTKCHQYTGICVGGCEKGWYGDRCEQKTYINIAQGKTANQTSTYGEEKTKVFNEGKCTDMKSPMTANKSVDGNYNPGYIHRSCSATEGVTSSRWRVTFDKPYTISQLRIYNRISQNGRPLGFKVHLESDICFESNSKLEDIIDITCNEKKNASYVEISRSGGKMLTLCEVEVLQCKLGFHGNICMERCELCDNSKCDQFTGKCEEGCVKGYFENATKVCEECNSGTFGKNCNKTCHCKNNTNCDKKDGTCADGCLAGYQDADCQRACEEEKFGLDCNGTCHCINNINCDRENGTCSDGCAKGYRGYNCQKACEEGTFGLDCNGTCHCINNINCDRENGKCSDGCAEGYRGYNCQKEKRCNILMVVLIPLCLFICLIVGVVAALFYCKKRRSTSKCNHNNLALTGRGHTEDISEDTEMNNSEGIYVNMTSFSFMSNLQQFVYQKKQEIEPFYNEFLALPSTLPLACNEACKPAHVQKNRYKTILPYDHSRVKLLPDEISSSGYINANYINNKSYIACQGPTENTVTDFWRMVWQLKCDTIVMLTDVMEKGKRKCTQYWPYEESTESFGTIQIRHINVRCYSTYVHRRFIISKPSVNHDESWTIDHFFFNKWPDHGIPQHPEYILNFRSAMKYGRRITLPLIVHCSAGVGRSGTYICIDILLNEMTSGEDVDVLATIRNLREDRMHMVQKRKQLEFIYDVLVENIHTGNYDIDINDIPKEFSRLKKIDHSTGISVLQQQFQDIIENVEEIETKVTLSEGNEELQNLSIKTVLLSGSSCENECLLTKTPEGDETVDFLKIVCKCNYLNIVAFTNSGRERPNYLPKKLNETVKYGPFHIKLTSVEEEDICIHSVLKVTFDDMSRCAEFEINHFLTNIWMDGNYPSSTDIIRLSNVLSNYQRDQLNRKFAVLCSEHFHKSGLLYIIHTLKDAITNESVINIVRLVRLINKIKPKIVPDCDAYIFIWNVAEYLQSELSLYSNVA